jgi:CRP/FNR family transcriptional regulator
MPKAASLPREDWAKWPFLRLDPENGWDSTAVNLYDGVAPEDVAMIQGMATVITLPPRRNIFQHGEPALHVFNVLKGVVKLSRVNHDGTEHVAGFLFAGDCMGLASQSEYACSADTITSVSLWRIPRDQLADLVVRQPPLNLGLLCKATDDLLAAQRQALILGYRSGQDRVLAFLVELRRACRRVGLNDETLSIPMTRRDIAGYLGLTEGFVSRTLRALHRAGVIRLDGVKVHLVNQAALQPITDDLC